MNRLVAWALFLGLLALPAAGAAEDPDRYAIGPGDALEISVWKDESLTRQIIVPPDGMISFPLIGEVDGNGRTVPQLQEDMKTRLTDFIPDVTLTVMLLDAASLRAYVIGKVNKPGVFPITKETSVLQVLAMAGGLNPFASEGDILILRQKGDQVVKLPFDYGRIQEGKDLERNIRLERGDVVVVP